VLLYDKFDVWKVPTDGAKAQKLTDGAVEQVRHRLVRTGQDEDWIDLSKPVYVSLFGTWSKKNQGTHSSNRRAVVDRLIWLDKSVGSLGEGARSRTSTRTSSRTTTTRRICSSVVPISRPRSR